MTQYLNYLGSQRCKPKPANRSFSSRRHNSTINSEASNSQKDSRITRRNSSSALLNSSASLRSGAIIGHTKSIVSRPSRRKKRAKSAIGSFNAYLNPSKVAVHNKPWK